MLNILPLAVPCPWLPEKIFAGLWVFLLLFLLLQKLEKGCFIGRWMLEPLELPSEAFVGAVLKMTTHEVQIPSCDIFLT